jgi:hypothetical protein
MRKEGFLSFLLESDRFLLSIVMTPVSDEALRTLYCQYGLIEGFPRVILARKIVESMAIEGARNATVDPFAHARRQLAAGAAADGSASSPFGLLLAARMPSHLPGASHGERPGAVGAGA